MQEQSNRLAVNVRVTKEFLENRALLSQDKHAALGCSCEGASDPPPLRGLAASYRFGDKRRGT